jgi:hypothetical protein
MADLSNQNIDDYVGMSPEELREIDNQLSLWINQQQVAERRNFIRQLIEFRELNPDDNHITVEFLRQRIPLQRGDQLRRDVQMQVTYQRLRIAGGRRKSRKTKKYKKTRKARKSKRRRR